jgi:signal transduction histidine kinase
MLEQYAGRPRTSVPVSISISREAAEYLRRLAGQRNLGHVITRLVLEERARAEERLRIGRELIVAAGGSEL